MSYNKKNIKFLLDKIADKEFVLPAIQREFVWTTDQIETLFDSLMRGYPIGSFLFWNIKAENVRNYQFYYFLSKYHERDCHHNIAANPSGNKPITAILDGQQRLTSLYIGLYGSYTEKKKGVKAASSKAYPEKQLYLNLLAGTDKDLSDDDYNATDMTYEFKFLSNNEINNSGKYWFKVSDIMKINVMKYAIHELQGFSPEQQERAGEILNDLKNLIEHKEIINYFEENEQDLDKVLNIFIRVNSKGTPLSYSDLLLTTATALWQEHNAREEIYALVDSLNCKGMNLNTDFVMKSSLMLTDLDIKFLVKNFTKNNMKIIESQWDLIKEYLELSVSLLQRYGYNHLYIPAYNVLLPIAYYLKISNIDSDKFLTNPSCEQDRKTIIKWVRRAFIKQIFSGGSDATLSAYREVIKAHYTGGFPFSELEKRFKGKHQDISFSEEDIEELLSDANYNNKKRLYPILTGIFKIPAHTLEMTIDHMFPKSSFTAKNLSRWGYTSKEKQEEVLSWVNHIANLQLLESSHNKVKSAQEFDRWIKTQDQAFKDDQLVPTMDSYSPQQFVQFCKKRSQLLLQKLKQHI
ncbi:MAG: DUF262 domain-containing protein [Brevinema sp.]